MRAAMLWLAAAAATAGAEPALLDTIAARLARSPVVRAEVEQIKTLRVLSRPMHSSGSLLFSRDHGLLWDMHTPFAVQTVITEQRLVQMADGERTELHTARQPALAGITAVFFPVLAGDLARLAGDFTIEAQGVPEHWQLRLTPRHAPLNGLIDHLQLNGGDELERLLITDHADERTELRFFAIAREPALSPEEEARFAP